MLRRETRLRGVALEHLDEGLEEVEVLLLNGGEVGADDAEGLSAFSSADISQIFSPNYFTAPQLRRSVQVSEKGNTVRQVLTLVVAQRDARPIECFVYRLKACLPEAETCTSK